GGKHHRRRGRLKLAVDFGALVEQRLSTAWVCALQDFVARRNVFGVVAQTLAFLERLGARDFELDGGSVRSRRLIGIGRVGATRKYQRCASEDQCRASACPGRPSAEL